MIGFPSPPTESWNLELKFKYKNGTIFFQNFIITSNLVVTLSVDEIGIFALEIAIRKLNLIINPLIASKIIDY